MRTLQFEDTGRDCKNRTTNHLAGFSKSAGLSQDMCPRKLEIDRVLVTGLDVSELEN